MPIRVKMAQSPQEMDGLFRTRHRVFCEEEKYLKSRPEERIYDRYDAFPTTGNIIALVNNEVVGGLRLTEHSSSGNPAFDLFDFSPYLHQPEARIASASMLCLKREVREIQRLCYMMFSLATSWAISRAITHVIAAINPAVERLIQYVGFQAVRPAFRDEKHGINILPMMLEVTKMNPDFIQQTSLQGMGWFWQAFDREYYRAGETIMQTGSPGDAAYIIIHGRVGITRQGRRATDSPDNILWELGPQEILGEVSLLADKPRESDAYALTEVDLMVLEKDVFWKKIRRDSGVLVFLLQLLGQRFSTSMERLTRLSPQSLTELAPPRDALGSSPGDLPVH